VRSRIEAQPQSADVLGSLTLVYDHHAHDLADQMAALQHAHHGLVVSVLHVHISHDDCMEVIVLRGAASGVRELADALLSLKGVKHGRLFVTLPAQHITGRKAVAASAHEHHNHPHTHEDSTSRRGYG